jgi:hypothetical protein
MAAGVAVLIEALDAAAELPNCATDSTPDVFPELITPPSKTATACALACSRGGRTHAAVNVGHLPF